MQISTVACLILEFKKNGTLLSFLLQDEIENMVREGEKHAAEDLEWDERLVSLRIVLAVHSFHFQDSAEPGESVSSFIAFLFCGAGASDVSFDFLAYNLDLS